MRVRLSFSIIQNLMTSIDPIAVFDLLILPSFIDEATCAGIIDDMRSSAADHATVYGRDAAGAVDERVRKAMRHSPTEKTVAYVYDRLEECKPSVEAHFKVTLKEIDPPQFLHYREGDFFVAHQDGNTGLIKSDTEARLISVIILLSQQSDDRAETTYSGGSLMFHDWWHGRGSAALPPSQPGTLIAFRAETTREVT